MRRYDHLSDDDLIGSLGKVLPTKKPISPSVSCSSHVPLASRSPDQHHAEMGKRGEARGGLRLESVARSPDVTLDPRYTTSNGMLLQGDCLEYLPRLRSGLVHTVFADPPFNLGKRYGDRSVDSRTDAEYVEWCRDWFVSACVSSRRAERFLSTTCQNGTSSSEPINEHTGDAVSALQSDRN